MGSKFDVRKILALAGCLLCASMLCAQDQPQPTPPPPPAPDSQPGQTNSPPPLQSQPPQTTTPPPNGQSPAPDAPSKTKTQEELEKQRLEQSYRVMGVVPMFGTTSRKNATPLTKGEKFHLFVRSAFDPVNFVVVGAQAGISQAQNSFDGYGQGAEGYAKRYGAAFADSVDANFFSNFFYPVLFRQDPRYFRLGEGSVKHRIGYALVQEFVAHKDNGGRTFHFSNVMGAFTAGGISNAYYPDEDRGFGLTMSRAGIALLYGALGGEFSEFWPDIQRKIFKHKEKPGIILPTDSVVPPPAPK
jgi:hypothetical protein